MQPSLWYGPSDTTAVKPKCDDCGCEVEALHILPHIQIEEYQKGVMVIRDKTVCSSCYHAHYAHNAPQKVERDWRNPPDLSGG